jgi:hypothetical protein
MAKTSANDIVRQRFPGIFFSPALLLFGPIRRLVESFSIS